MRKNESTSNNSFISMKKIACTLLLALATTFSHAQTHTGNLTLSSQTEIDDFNATEVTGDLTIEESVNNDITNLNGLSGLAEIQGVLTITINPSLISLSGLDSLTEIGGGLHIFSNATLASLSGLESLTDIRGYLRIRSNASLASLSGLDSLTEIGGYLYIGNNDSLTSLSGLESLTDIGGYLNILSNDSLTSLSGLESLTDIGGNLGIQSNASLTSLSGLEMLDSIGGTLSITGNTALTDFCLISSLIGDDKQITSGEYTVNTNSYNPSYGLISNETFCSNADGGIFIGDLTLDTQDSIDDFRYRAITGNLIIDESVANAITNLDGLSELTNIGGELRIQTNDSLVSLSGLELLASIGGTLSITENTALTDFCAISSLIGDDKQITSGEYTVTTNGYNPSYGLISNETFCSNADGGIFIGDLRLDTQNSIDVFRYRGVTGDLTILETTGGNIMNLDSLESLTEIGGYLSIFSNPSLSSLSGLDALTQVGGYLRITSNASLTSLSGLEMLDSIGGTLSLTDNRALTDFCAVSSLVGDANQITSTEYTVSNNSYNPTYSDIQLCNADADERIFVGNLRLTTQENINGFNYRVVTGDLTISNISFTPLISDLSDLGSLIEVGGDLSIIVNSSLESLSGLDSLIEIGGSLSILGTGPNSLESLSGLESLIEIGGNLSILGNNSLESLSGLDSLTEIGGFLNIQSTISLSSLSGLSSLTDIGGYLNIESNSSLMSLSGLSSLTDIGGYIIIDDNTILPSLEGLEMLDSIGGTLSLTGNTALTDFCAISSLVGDANQITAEEYIVNTNGYNPPYNFIQNESLCSNVFVGNLRLSTQESINTFNYRVVIGDLTINGGNITNLDGLSGLAEIQGFLDIQNNLSLTSLSGLDSLTDIGRYLYISSNSSLMSLSGLDALTDIGGDLRIISNATLPSLSGLDALTDIGGDLFIINNATLPSLSGLEMLDSIGSRLIIERNPILTNFCVLSSVVGDENQITSEGYSVNYNNYNPSYVAIQTSTACSITETILTSQAAINAFSTTEVGNLIIEEATPGDITNLTALSSLTTIGNTLEIKNNTALTSLSGLEMLDSLGGRLIITGNPTLTNFCTISTLVGNENDITRVEYIVNTNGYNPSYTFIQTETLCSPSAGVFDGNLILTSQEAIDTFNYTAITGNLDILETIGGNIMNLDSLESLIAIGGYLGISSNLSLMSLSGLDSLTDIGGYLSIDSNDSLISLSGLEALTDIGGYLSIDSNDSLMSLSGLEALTDIGGYLNILSNASLMSLSGLDSLTDIGGYLNIESNASLMSLSGLDALTRVGEYLRITSNPTLPSLSGLEMLDFIGERLIITRNTDLTDFCTISPLIGDENQITRADYTINTNGYNPTYNFIQNDNLCSNADGGIYVGNTAITYQGSVDAFRYRGITGNLTIEEATPGNITNLEGLRTLTQIGRDLIINSNASLSSLSGLENLTGIGRFLQISDNSTLTSLSGLDSLNQIGENLSISSNASLSSLRGLDALNEIGGNLDINSNASLTSLSGLDSLTEIGENLAIQNNGLLASLSSLEFLTDIGGNLDINSNATLTSLSGLEILEVIGGTLSLTENTALTDFCAISPLIGDENQITRVEYTVNTNGYNPSYTFIQTETLCSPSAGIFDGNLILTSQEAIDTFNYTAITGNLDILETIGGNIMNLDSLESLIAIGGYLGISSNLSLMSLSGLDSLTDIGGYLSIDSNDSLISLSGLEALTDIGGYLSIDSNDFLISLSGLEALTDIGGYLNILSNASLMSLSGLDSLTDIGGYLNIESNASLSSLSGLEMLDFIGGRLIITRNTDLTDFCTISPLIGDENQITRADYTVNTNGYNPTYNFIQNENFCSNADGGIYVGNITIAYQGNIDVFRYRGITGTLTIEEATPGNITNLEGLRTLTQIGGDLDIQSNATLSSLSGLDSLTEIGGNLIIDDNAILPSLEGLEMLDSIGGVLSLTGNTALTNFCAISSLIDDANQITLGDYTVTTNGYNPLYTEIQTTTRCSLDPPVVVADLQDVSIQTGDSFDPINLESSFSDPNRYALTYTATSSDETAVTVSISESTLTLTEVNGEGTATITVTATNDSVLSVSDEFTVSITPNMPPTVANSLIDVEIVSGTAFERIDISAVFSDPDGDDDALIYRVATSNESIVTAALNGTTLTLTETGKGTATITVTATDTFGLSVDATFEVTIMNTAPEIVPNQLVTVFTQSGTPFAPIDLSAAFTDANGDELTYTTTSDNETVVTVSVSGTTLTLTEVNGEGTATITVTATDGEASVSATFTISITQNLPPTVANSLTDVDIVSGTAFERIDISAVFSDPDGDDDALIYRVATSNESIVTAALNGTTLTLTETGKGTATITVTATDTFGLSVDASFEATITNTAPEIVPNQLVTVFTQSGTPFAPIDLSAAFTDANGDELTYTTTSDNETVVTVSVSGTTLTLTEVNGEGTATITVTATDGDESVSATFTVSITQNLPPTVENSLTDVGIVSGTAFERIDISAVFSDPDGDDDALIYRVATSNESIVTAALNGTTLTLTETGKGTATITVTATDTFGLSVDASFEATITNTAPEIVPNQLVTVFTQSGTPFAPIDLSAAFTDANGDELTYTATSSDETVVTVSVSGTTLTLTEVNGEGTATITVTATDGDESVSATFTVSITQNLPPTVANSLTDVGIVSGTAFERIDISAVFSDPDGDDDALIYRVATSNESIVTAALNGTTLTLIETGKGTATITVTATDTFGLSVDASFEATITNTAPVVANPLEIAFTQPGTPFAPIDLSAAFTDANGDELTYTAISSDETVVTVSVSGTTLTLTEVNGEGTATITVTATDGDESVSATFTVSITQNLPPTVENSLTDVGIVSGTAFERIDISAVFSDPDGDDDALIYRVATSNESIVTAALNGTTLTLTETGKGTATITVTATDTFGLSVDASFEVTIMNTAPEIVPNQLVTVFTQSGTPFAPIDLSAAFTDANGDELTYTATSSDETVVTVSVSGTTLTLTEVNGEGTATITVTATDGDESVSATFTVSITQNLPPTVENSLTDVGIVSGTAFERIDLSAVFSDPDGDDDALIYRVATSNESIVTAALNGTTLTLIETGKGTATITVTATDGDGASVDETFMVTISSSTNTSPIRTPATFISTLMINIDYVGSPTSLIPFFIDPDGDVLEFSVESSDITIVTAEIVNGSSFNFTPVSIGSATLTITATDPGGLSASERSIITVIATEEKILGIADTDILAVYPNPSSGVFQLSRTADVVRVYDMSGRLVYRGRKIKQLDLTSQPLGQYLVEVRVGKERGRYTVIKQ